MPIQLRQRGVATLLKTVGGKDTLSQETTPPTTQTQPGEQEDIERSPESSEDEEMIAAAAQVDGVQQKEAAKGATAAPPESSTGRRGPLDRAVDEITENIKRRSKRGLFQDEGAYASQAHKRQKQDDIITLDGDDDDHKMDSWTSQTQKSKSSQRTYPSKRRTHNIHENPSPDPSPAKPSGFQIPNSKTSTKKGSQDAKGRRTFRKLPVAESALDESAGNQKSNKSTFRAPKLSPKPEKAFKLPNGASNVDAIDLHSSPPGSPLSSSSSRLSTPPPEAELDDLDLIFAATQQNSQRELARCPVCQEYIDKEALELFTRGQRVGWRDKQVFCESHRRRDAEKLWKEKGYPDINWDTAVLSERMKRFKREMESIMDGTQRSEFLEKVRQKVGSGRIRKALKHVNEARSEIVTPGYYGPRGSQVMQAHLLSAFAERLREMAVKGDEVVRATGAGNYVSRVLVPEMAVRLIGEDMGVDGEKARVVMDESAEVGKLCNGFDAGDEEVAVKVEKV